MPALSRAARIYKSILKQTGKKELPYIREQLRVMSPEALEKISSVHVREALSNMGELTTIGGLDRLSMHPKALERATDALFLKRDFPTFAHEVGHSTLAGVSTDEMRKLVSGQKMSQYLEDRADEFAMVAAARAGIPVRGTMKMTPEKRQKIFKYLLGAGAGAGATVMGQDDELLAMNLRFMKGAVKGTVSSAAKVLKGTEIKPGKVVKDVIKGTGKWRKIQFEDGTYATVTAENVNELCRAVGTKRYVQAFEQKPSEDRTLQAIKSLRYHEARAKPFQSREMIRRHHADFLKSLKEADDALPPDTVFVIRGSGYFQMPREYAEHLEDLGILKIVKGKKETDLLKPYVREK